MSLIEAPRRLSIRLAAETIRVGRAHGFKLETIHTHAADEWLKAADGDKAALDAIETTMVAASKGRPDDRRPSMGQDMAKGRRTEIEFLNGLVVEEGREAGSARQANGGTVNAGITVARGEARQGPERIAGL